MMQQLTCIEPGQFAYGQQPVPSLESGTALVRIRRIGICGTDLHAYEGTQPYFSYPRILGHELAGELVGLNGAGGFQPGQRVTILPYYNCGDCIACRSGKPNCCVQLQVCGVHCDGGMRTYLRVPAAALVDGSGLDWDALALVEPYAIGAHGVRRAGVQPGETVLVVGAGPIGLTVMAMSQLAGARVIALDVNENRLQFCRSGLGVAHVVNSAAADPVAAIQSITQGNMPEVVIDATGNLNAINTAFRYLAHGGRYVLVGLQKGDITFSHPEFHKREATLMSSRNATRADFEQVIGLMRNQQLKPLGLVTHRVNFEQAASAFPQWLRPESRTIKAMVVMD